MNLSVALGMAGAPPSTPPGASVSLGGRLWGNPPPPSPPPPPPPPPAGRWFPRNVGQLLCLPSPQLNAGAGCAVAVVNTVHLLVPGGSLIVIVAMLVSITRDSAGSFARPSVCSVSCVLVVASLISVVSEVVVHGGSLSSSPWFPSLHPSFNKMSNPSSLQAGLAATQ